MRLRADAGLDALAGAFATGRPLCLRQVVAVEGFSASDLQDLVRAARPPPRVAASVVTSRRRQAQLVVEADAPWEALVETGWSVCFDFEGDEGRGVFELARELAARVDRKRALASLYCSPEGGGVGLHFDPHPVLVVQLEGSKIWEVSATPATTRDIAGFLGPDGRAYRANVAAPEPAVDEHGRQLEPPESRARHRLEEGDLLFVPRRHWHGTRAPDFSISLSVSPHH